MSNQETNDEDVNASDCPPVTETFAQYSFRMAREARLRKEVIAKEAAERKERSKEERRLERESRRRIRPELMVLASIVKEQLLEAEKAKAAKAAEIEQRKEAKICVCCGDARGIKRSRHCEQCWRELTHGVIEPPTVSERQVQSAACRVVRKGTEMS